MKKGKSVKLNLYSPIKSVYGTVDSKNLKSLEEEIIVLKTKPQSKPITHYFGKK